VWLPLLDESVVPSERASELEETNVKSILFVSGACLVILLFASQAGTAPAPFKPTNSPDVVVMDTSLGKIKLKLYAKQAPLTVANFLRYVDERFYDNTILHRVIPKFVLQGGGLDTSFQTKKTHKPIKNESSNGLSNKRGTIACARAAAPDSATSQFYINLKDNTFLDSGKAGNKSGYCVFAEVIEGMDVVDKIAAVKTGQRGIHRDVPVQSVVIQSVRRASK
jgi:cyclophilin family peptidyl-prolyl cis-trans isomerase